MASKAPFLNRPAPGWKNDLPAPDDSLNTAFFPVSLAAPPNFTTNSCMEISTRTLKGRGVITWLGISSLFMHIWFTFTIFIPSIGDASFGENLASIALIVMGFWLGIFFIRTDTALPRDEPIRFNRLRRKVYAYHYKRDWKRPLSRTAWGVHTAVYDWDDLHAEACETYGALGTGGHSQAVMLSARVPGTRDILHRFQLSHSLCEGEEYWAMIRVFMQQGPHALPPFKYPVRDRNNEESHFNIFWRFAPKVEWPADMDLESRTAP